MFQKIDHIAILVEDMARGRQLFEDIYGFECWATNSEEHREAAGADAAFLDAGDVILELMSPLDRPDNDGWAARHMTEHGEGFFHIAYQVEDVYETKAALEERGISMMMDEPRKGFSGMIMTCDPADTVMPTQFVEPNGSIER